MRCKNKNFILKRRVKRNKININTKKDEKMTRRYHFIAIFAVAKQ